MIALFLLCTLFCSIAIYRTGAWHDESSRLHDMVAFVLLGNVIWVLALIFRPYVSPFGVIEFTCVSCEPWRTFT